MITGLDIVEWMIRITNGERLTIKQEDVKIRGWAVETRVYAEDPDHDFMPSTGRLMRYRTPAEDVDVRVNNGVFEGGEISRFYDPMIAKVTTWGLGREQAVQRMRMALDEFYIQGVSHNIAFLTALLANPRFREGRLSTSFIPTEYPEGFSPAPLEPEDLNAIIGAAVLMHLRYMQRAARTSGQMPGYQFCIPDAWEVVVNGEYYPVNIHAMSEGFDISLAGGRNDGQIIAVRSDWQVGDPVLRCTVNAIPNSFKVDRDGLGYVVYHLGAEVSVLVRTCSAARLARLMPVKVPPDMSMYLLSPMPGLLRSVAVTEGQEVETGTELCVVEAMKMEDILRASRPVKIAGLRARPGDILAVGQVILEYESGAQASA